MFDLREGIIEVMEQGSPLLVLRGLTKSDCVIFESVPPYEETVTILLLDATLEFMASVAPHSNDNPCGFYKRGFKWRFETWLHIQYCNFENHA